jgi:hypothetical protein
MHFDVDGSIFYGMKLESVQDKMRDNISLVHLAKVFVDVHQDSSRYHTPPLNASLLRIAQDLISDYQRSQLDLIYHPYTDNRQTLKPSNQFR